MQQVSDAEIHNSWPVDVFYDPNTETLMVYDYSEAGMYARSRHLKRGYKYLGKYPTYYLLKALVEANPELKIRFSSLDLAFSRLEDKLYHENINPKEYGIDAEKREITVWGLFRLQNRS